MTLNIVKKPLFGTELDISRNREKEIDESVLDIIERLVEVDFFCSRARTTFFCVSKQRISISRVL
jgi:hypothetical protein